jgi:polyphosphate kinase
MERYLNRDLSILRFNERVLGEAAKNKLPQLERLKFIAIVASNLDEFFMVRVGGILRLMDAEKTLDVRFSFPMAEQIKKIRDNVNSMIKQQYKLLNEEILSSLKKQGLLIHPSWKPGEDSFKQMESYFNETILPVLTPSIIKAEPPSPMLPALRIHVAVRIKGKNDEFAVIPVPPVIDRFLEACSKKENSYIAIEQLIKLHIRSLFPGQSVMEAVAFRITRNADLEVQEDRSPDLLHGMKEILQERKFSACVRLEVEQGMSEKLTTMLSYTFNVTKNEIYEVPGLLQLQDFHKIAALDEFANLRHEEFVPSTVVSEEPIFEQIQNKDILLHHPYDSYDPVVRFVREAAEDPDVLAIKQSLYRVTQNSPIVAALKHAASKGKQVTALIELKARFDEERNITQAQNLEETGAQVIYGIKGLKTHAKICLIIKKQEGRIVRYAHFGTGNYNERTAKLYTDFSLLTSNDELCSEGADFFNAICGYSEPPRFTKIASAPIGLKEKLIELIDGEAERRKQGDRRAAINAKMNSLADPEIIDSLYRASKAGVKIRLNVRGICCLRPGVKGLSENITVVSIVGRFLEHSRIFHFRQNGSNAVYISSADWMVRNLERRIELMVPVEADETKALLLNYLNDCFRDNVKSHRLLEDGTYEPTAKKMAGKPFDLQSGLVRNIRELANEIKKRKRTVFVPLKKKKT